MKKRPFLTLVLLVIITTMLGMFAGLFFYESYEVAAYKEAREKSLPQPTEIGDAIPFFLLIGGTTGFFLGVAGGSFWFVKVKAEAKEIEHIILK